MQMRVGGFASVNKLMSENYPQIKNRLRNL